MSLFSLALIPSTSDRTSPCQSLMQLDHSPTKVGRKAIESRGDAASARAAATRHGVDQATPAREMRSSEGRVLETADAFLDDRADRLWRTRAAALRELAQKVRDGTDLVLLCAGRIESCHGDLLRKGILAEAAQLEATSKRKPRSDKGKPRGPRGPRADSVETAARMGVLSTFYLRHAYGRDSPGLHEEDGVLSANGGVLCAGCGEEAPGLGARDGGGASRHPLQAQGDTK